MDAVWTSRLAIVAAIVGQSASSQAQNAPNEPSDWQAWQNLPADCGRSRPRRSSLRKRTERTQPPKWQRGDRGGKIVQTNPAAKMTERRPRSLGKARLQNGSAEGKWVAGTPEPGAVGPSHNRLILRARRLGA